MRLLRREPRRGAIVAVGNVNIVRVEPDQAAVEDEAGRPREGAIGIWRPLVTGAINPEVVVVLEADRVRERHDTDHECAKTDLAGRVFHDYAGTADRTATMADAELCVDDEDVRIALRLGQLVPELNGTGRLAQMLFVNLSVAVVVERAVASLLDGVEHLNHRLAVGRTEDLRVLLPVGDGEPSFGVRRQFDLALLDPRLQILIGKADAREQDAKLIALGVQIRGFLVAGEVAVFGLNLLVGEFVHHGKLADLLDSELPERFDECRIALETLGTLLAQSVECFLHEVRTGDVANHAGDEFLLTVRYGFCRLSKRLHDVSSFHIMPDSLRQVAAFSRMTQ